MKQQYNSFHVKTVFYLLLLSNSLSWYLGGEQHQVLPSEHFIDYKKCFCAITSCQASSQAVTSLETIAMIIIGQDEKKSDKARAVLQAILRKSRMFLSGRYRTVLTDTDREKLKRLLLVINHHLYPEQKSKKSRWSKYLGLLGTGLGLGAGIVLASWWYTRSQQSVASISGQGHKQNQTKNMGEMQSTEIGTPVPKQPADRVITRQSITDRIAEIAKTVYDQPDTKNIISILERTNVVQHEPPASQIDANHTDINDRTREPIQQNNAEKLAPDNSDQEPKDDDHALATHTLYEPLRQEDHHIIPDENNAEQLVLQSSRTEENHHDGENNSQEIPIRDDAQTEINDRPPESIQQNNAEKLAPDNSDQEPKDNTIHNEQVHKKTLEQAHSFSSSVKKELIRQAYNYFKQEKDKTLYENLTPVRTTDDQKIWVDIFLFKLHAQTFKLKKWIIKEWWGSHTMYTVEANIVETMRTHAMQTAKQKKMTTQARDYFNQEIDTQQHHLITVQTTDGSLAQIEPFLLERHAELQEESFDWYYATTPSTDQEKRALRVHVVELQQIHKDEKRMQEKRIDQAHDYFKNEANKIDSDQRITARTSDGTSIALEKKLLADHCTESLFGVFNSIGDQELVPSCISLPCVCLSSMPHIHKIMKLYHTQSALHGHKRREDREEIRKNIRVAAQKLLFDDLQACIKLIDFLGFGESDIALAGVAQVYAEKIYINKDKEYNYPLVRIASLPHHIQQLIKRLYFYKYRIRLDQDLVVSAGEIGEFVVEDTSRKNNGFSFHEQARRNKTFDIRLDMISRCFYNQCMLGATNKTSQENSYFEAWYLLLSNTKPIYSDYRFNILSLKERKKVNKKRYRLDWTGIEKAFPNLEILQVNFNTPPTSIDKFKNCKKLKKVRIMTVGTKDIKLFKDLPKEFFQALHKIKSLESLKIFHCNDYECDHKNSYEKAQINKLFLENEINRHGLLNHIKNVVYIYEKDRHSWEHI